MTSKTGDEVIAGALELAREALGMDAAHVGLFVEGYQQIAAVTGEADSFGLEEGARIPLEETFCQRVVAGKAPQIIPDAAAEPEVADLPAVQQAVLGSYVGVPVTASDGTVYGTFCCVSRHPDPSLADRDITFMRVLGRLVGDRLQRERLEVQERERLELLVAQRTAELEVAQAETAMRLSRAVEFRDDNTGGHIERVGIMSELLARAAGLEEEQCRLIRLAAPLHDVGKVAAPDEVLLKSGTLDPDERKVIEAHPEVGHRLLEGSSSELLRLAATIARTHHERIDGGGYSRSLSGEEIPIEGRIVAIADVFDALTRNRIYRPAMTVAEAMGLMRADEGHFDPELLELFFDKVVPTLAEG